MHATVNRYFIRMKNSSRLLLAKRFHKRMQSYQFTKKLWLLELLIEHPLRIQHKAYLFWPLLTLTREHRKGKPYLQLMHATKTKECPWYSPLELTQIIKQ